MANTNAPFGARPVRNLARGGDIALSPYTIASGENSTFRLGDLVKLSGTGTNLTAAAAGDVTLGVFVGCTYTDTQNNFQFTQQWVAGTTTLDGSAAQALVWNDQNNTIFQIQCDTLAAGDVGAHADINVGTGNSLYKKSGMYLDIGAGTATSGKTFRILRLSDIPGNEYGAYAVADVMFGEGFMLSIASSAAGV